MLKRLLPLVVILAIGGGVYWYTSRPITSITLTGTVTTNEIVVSPQIGGRIERLLVNEGDVVTKDQLVAVLAPAELQQERAYYNASVEGAGSQVAESEAALRLQERQTTDQIKQAQATLAAVEAQHQAAQAQLEDARLALERQQRMMKDGVGTQELLDRARTAADVARSQLAALAKQVDAQRSTVALAEANAEQVSVRRSQVSVNRQQQAAATAQRAKADVRLAYTEIHAPIAGIVDVRVALPGEVVNPGQPVVTLVNPDDLWVRADVEETYIDRIKVGDKMRIRLPSGDEIQGEVFFRRRRCRLRDAARREPHQARHQDVRDPAQGGQQGPPAGRGHDHLRRAAPLLGNSAMATIEVKSIVKKFGDFTAVDGVSFTVESGEVFGLLGPNGAGKSTLIRMLVTLLPPTSGSAAINGFDVVKRSDDVRRSIGVIPQAMTSDLELTVEENLLIFAKLYGVPRVKRTKLMAELLEAVELTQWADKPVKNLSGGMRRRVEIARGLVHEPKVFFLDEPTTGLDPVSRTGAWAMLQKIKAERDLTVLLTTHYMDEADKLCDRIAIVDHGKLVALDTPAGLKASIPSDNPEKTTLDDVFVHYAGRDLRDALQAPSAADSPFALRR